MNPTLAAILGLVEGLTEYLPVSSTGHLTLASHFLHVPKEEAGVFDVVIQFGAILAVVVHYRKLLAGHLSGIVRAQKPSINLALALAAGFLPTAVLGLLFRKAIKKQLLGPLPVVAALVVGGIFMIGMDIWFQRREQADENVRKNEKTLDDLGPKEGLLVGLGQCFALWPGMSRSMSSMVAGRLAGLSAQTSAEFSFLLGLPTLGAACVYEGLKERAALATIGAGNLAIGLLVSFLVAWGVVATFIKLIGKVGFVPFGIYRIVLAAVTYWALAR
jgi:undecaprenyl-diphosphatase